VRTSSTRTPPSKWELEEAVIDGESYLLDRRAGKVLRSQSGGRPPRVVGKLMGSEVTLAPASVDFFNSLDEYLKEERIQLRELFEEADVDRSGALDRRELSRMLERVLPGISRKDVAYLEAQLDADGDGVVTYEELIEFLRDCRSAGEAVSSSKPQDELDGVLRKFASRMNSDDGLRKVRAAFDDADRAGTGELDGRALSRFIRDACPGLKKTETRLLIAHLRAADPEAAGRLSLEDIMHAVGSVAYTSRQATGRYKLNKAAPAQRRERRKIASDEWVLEALESDGYTFWHDRQTGKVYIPGTQRDDWPTLWGSISPHSTLPEPLRLHEQCFERIDQYFRTHQQFLRDLFDESEREDFALDRAVLYRALLSVLPLPVRDAGYLQAQLFADGAEPITLKQLSRLMSECRSAEAIASASASLPFEQKRMLARIGAHILKQGQQVESLFSRIAIKTGSLEGAELVRFLQRLLPDAERKETRLLVAHVYASDPVGSGSFTIVDIRKALHGVKLVPPRARTSGAPPAPAHLLAPPPPPRHNLRDALPPLQGGEDPYNAYGRNDGYHPISGNYPPSGIYHAGDAYGRGHGYYMEGSRGGETGGVYAEDGYRAHDRYADGGYPAPPLYPTERYPESYETGPHPDHFEQRGYHAEGYQDGRYPDDGYAMPYSGGGPGGGDGYHQGERYNDRFPESGGYYPLQPPASAPPAPEVPAPAPVPAPSADPAPGLAKPSTESKSARRLAREHPELYAALDRAGNDPDWKDVEKVALPRAAGVVAGEPTRPRRSAGMAPPTGPALTHIDHALPSQHADLDVSPAELLRLQGREPRPYYGGAGGQYGRYSYPERPPMGMGRYPSPERYRPSRTSYDGGYNHGGSAAYGPELARRPRSAPPRAAAGLPPPDSDPFKHVCRRLQESRDLQRHFESGSRGRRMGVDRRELWTFIRRTFPELSTRDVAYIVACVDCEGKPPSQGVSFNDFALACQEGRIAAQALGTRPDDAASAVQEVLRSLHERSAEAHSLFRRIAGEASTQPRPLEPSEVLRVIRALLPRDRAHALRLRLALAALRRFEPADGDGRFNYDELTQALMRASEALRRVRAGDGSGGSSSLYRRSYERSPSRHHPHHRSSTSPYGGASFARSVDASYYRDFLGDGQGEYIDGFEYVDVIERGGVSHLDEESLGHRKVMLYDPEETKRQNQEATAKLDSYYKWTYLQRSKLLEAWEDAEVRRQETVAAKKALPKEVQGIVDAAITKSLDLKTMVLDKKGAAIEAMVKAHSRELTSELATLAKGVQAAAAKIGAPALKIPTAKEKQEKIAKSMDAALVEYTKRIKEYHAAATAEPLAQVDNLTALARQSPAGLSLLQRQYIESAKSVVEHQNAPPTGDVNAFYHVVPAAEYAVHGLPPQTMYNSPYPYGNPSTAYPHYSPATYAAGAAANAYYGGGGGGGYYHATTPGATTALQFPSVPIGAAFPATVTAPMTETSDPASK